MSVPLHSVPADGEEMATLEHTAGSFEDFFREEHAGLFRALCLVTGSRQEAEDIMQIAFMKVFERWERVAVMVHPQGFLYRIAMNEFRSAYRRAARATKRAVTPGEPDDAFSSVENRDVVIRALRQLIPQQRAAIVLTSLLGYSSGEAGDMLGMSASTVRALGTRARTSLRESVGEIR